MTQKISLLIKAYLFVIHYKITMNTQELLQLMRLLAALESWAFAQGKMLPDYLHEDLNKIISKIELEILKK